MLRTSSPALRTLERRDRDAVLALCATDPVSNVMVAERVERVGSEPVRLGGEIWGWFSGGELTSACWSGANLVPVNAATAAALDAFAEQAARHRGRYSSLFGPADAVLGLWSRLEQAGWRARQVRPSQPLFSMTGPSAVPPDPLVRRAELDEMAVIMPASVAMFTEEVGYSPLRGDGGASYRRRVSELIADRRTFVRRAPSGDRHVVFKADLGALSDQVAQVHGVWVDPRYRGRGLAAPAMAAVVAAALQDAPVVSLYVNDFNAPALATYRRVGFEQVGTFATVLF
ncbi:MAG TPA: GNAT family N-acetyltransferase [Actinomycetales bacterium]|nr:GNAT family N-acetyltransferase [Actinomycetales bacterium]